MPRLRFLAGPSLTDLSPLGFNSDVPLRVKSSGFDGQIAVYIKGLADSPEGRTHSPYFDHQNRKGITWSIQIQGTSLPTPSIYQPTHPHIGRFLQTHSADDIVFGNIFDKPLKLPWGFGTVMKFMRCAADTLVCGHEANPRYRYVDPTLQEDFASKSRPWALSPFVATMPHIHHTRLDDGSEPPSFPSPFEPIAEDMSRVRIRSSTNSRRDTPPRHRKQRKAHFKCPERRKDVVFGPNVSGCVACDLIVAELTSVYQDLITADFCHHYLDFGSDSIVLRLPCGISIDLLRYWDGQPVRFVCCERAKGANTDKQPWGKVLFCVAMVRDDDSFEKPYVSCRA